MPPFHMYIICESAILHMLTLPKKVEKKKPDFPTCQPLLFKNKHFSKYEHFCKHVCKHQHLSKHVHRYQDYQYIHKHQTHLEMCF